MTAKTTLLAAYLVSPIRYVYADAGLAGKLVGWTAAILSTVLHIVRKPQDQQGFTVIPRRWCVERTLAWLTAHRRLARDYERHPGNSEAMIRWAAINTITARITRGQPATANPAGTGPTPSRPLLQDVARVHAGSRPYRLLLSRADGTTIRRPGHLRRRGGSDRPTSAYLNDDLVIVFAFWRAHHPFPEERGRVFVARLRPDEFAAVLEDAADLMDTKSLG